MHWSRTQKLESDFEHRFMGQGVSYYAQADPSYYENKNAVVIGGEIVHVMQQIIYQNM